MTIGELARKASLRTSAIRYYESVGLMEAAVRTRSGQRVYSRTALDRLRLIQAARSAGLGVREVRELLNPEAPMHENWRRVAQEKLAELDRQRARLIAVSECGCSTVAECERRIAAANANQILL